jgi:cell division protein FtsI (penicillin-binding protein 3)
MTEEALAARLSAPRERARPRAAAQGDLGRMEWRIALLALGFIVSFGAAGARMATLAVSEPLEPLREAGAAEPTHAPRAPIVDRAGRALAINIPGWSAYAHPHEMDDRAEAARRIAAVLDGVSEETLTARFAPGRRFAWIKRPIAPEEKQAVHDLGIPGVYFGARELRVYPQGRLAAHVLGGVTAGEEGVHSAETVGLAGAERTHDAALRDPGRGGDPLRLSIDVPAQAALTDALREGMRRFEARAAGGVLMDARNGAVLALVSLPDFDPNNRPNPADPEVAAIRPMLNRVAEGVFEQGSTFKPLFAALAMDRGIATPETMLESKGPLVWGRFRIRDSHRMPPEMTLSEAIEESSNVAIGRLALRVGVDPFPPFLEALGMTEPTALEIAEARLGQPLLPRRWSEIALITSSFGHGVAVTPLHMAVAYAAIANGGLRVRPTLDPDAAPPTEADRVLSPYAAAQTRAMLRRTVSDGTGGFADVEGYEVAGKTGTAEKPRPGGGYDPKRVISSFASFFPASDPRYVLVVFLDEPIDRSGPYPRRTAGWTAAPVTGAAIARLAPLLGLRPKLAPPPVGEDAATLAVAARD